MSGPALLLIDLQRDYFPGGRMELEQAEAAAQCAAEVLARCRTRGWPIIHVRHESKAPGATFFLPGTDGTAFHQAVIPLPQEVVITKHYPNAFRGTPLSTLIQAHGVTELIIVGMMTHMCIDATVRAASDLSYRSWVVADATATRALSYGSDRVPAHKVATAFLAALDGTFARVVRADDPAAPWNAPSA